MRFKREPAIWVGLIGSLFTLAGTMGLPWLSAGQAATATVAASAAVIAFYTRPIAPALFTGAFAAVAALFADYGLHWSDAQVGAVSALILGGFSLFGVRPQVEPPVYEDGAPRLDPLKR